MKKPPLVALLCAGSFTESAIPRFRGLAARLGPVKAASLRLASRFSNVLRAGHPVNNYDEFPDCQLVIITVPDREAAAAIGELVQTGMDWNGKSVVLLSDQLESSELAALAELGAATATLCAAAGFDGRLLIAEGDKMAIRQIRPLIEGGRAKLLSLPAGQKKFYLAAGVCTGPLLASLLVCTSECLKYAGFAPSDAATILQVQVDKMTRSFAAGGSRRVFQDPAELQRYMAELSGKHGRIAELFELVRAPLRPAKG